LSNLQKTQIARSTNKFSVDWSHGQACSGYHCNLLAQTSPLDADASQLIGESVMDIIERAARALCIADDREPDRMTDIGPRWVFYAQTAKAVLSALREPDEGMQIAGQDSAENVMRIAYGEPDISHEGVAAIWQAMIDQALKG
jgi:hypothetical protein